MDLEPETVEVNAYVKREMKKRRNLFAKNFHSFFSTPLEMIRSALYAFISLESLGVKHKNCIAFCKDLMALANVALVPGAAFGMEGYARLAFSEKEEKICEGLVRLKQAVDREELKNARD